MGSASRSPARIAAIAPNWLGDAVMALPALHMLAGAVDSRFSVVASPYVARVFLEQPGIHDVWIDPAGGRVARMRRRITALGTISPRAAVIFPPSFSSALPAWLAGVPRRIGFRAEARAPLLTTALAMPSRSVHLADSYCELARAALASIDAPELAPVVACLAVSDAERAALRARPGLPAPGDYIVVVPGAAFGPAKSWPEERYRALCGMLAPDIRVVLAGSAGDRPVCERIAAAVPGSISVAGQTSLGEFFALLEGARALVANDSGAPHVAAALDVPCVVLFGSTSPAWTAPRGAHVHVLQHRVHCNPCYRRTCPTQLECFHGIAVDEVVAAAREALSVAREKAGAAGAASRIESSRGAAHTRPATRT